MSNGFEAAKGQRNLLERLMDKIPGYRGFQDRELRRDVDKLQREHLGKELGRIKGTLRELARRYTDAGQIAALGGFDRIDRTLDGVSQAVRFADYGATGIFDAVKIGDAELARLYEHDLAVLDDIAALDAAVGQVPVPGGDDPAAALAAVEQSVRALDEKWKRRKEVVSNVVATR
jgi:hypothetical protein